MNPEAAKRFRLLASAASVLLVLAIIAVAWIYWRVRASMPQLAGTAQVTGLSAAVTIERDALGVPTIRGASRRDVSRALGWLHAQERFFQMDLLRRNAAGELAEIFDKRALPRDRATRMHGFRKLAEQVVGRLPEHDRAVLDAYTAGVNAGLAALGENPWEYIVLRRDPQPWRPADSILVIYSMTLDLQDETGRYERTLMTLRDQLGLEALAFFAPLQTPADAALDGSTAPLPPIPGPNRIDLRSKVGAGGDNRSYLDPFPLPRRDPEAVLGSNAFALAGAHTVTGAGLLANDMHLDHGVPNTWYRASLEFAGKKITGVTLPGAPAMVAGSNGQVAWGFTASYADVGDLVVVDRVPGLESWYVVPGKSEPVAMEQRREVIAVRGGDPVTVDYTWTMWGPIVGQDEKQRPLAHRWVAHDPAATNLDLMAMEDARDTHEAIAIAHRAGIPAQNMLIADRAGNVAWTIAGKLPKRVGYDGRLPVHWTYGDRKWDGYLAPAEVPTLVQPASGRLWSANQRMVGGEGLAKIGDGGYPRPHRAAQIRDGLAPLERATPRDLLAVQLDNRAFFLEPWHKLMLETLNPAATEKNQARAALRAHVEKWEGRASIDAVSYRLVREFRSTVYLLAFPAIFQSCLEADPGFAWRDLQLEPALWAMLREKPAHLLNPKFATWDALLVHATDDVIKTLDKDGVQLPHANWGWANRARIRHPFSASFPWLRDWIDMPEDPLPGGADMPRVQSPTHGASERFVVSPGREAEGIFHMPGGQSAHPMSAFYRAGHDAWIRGDPTPFLPGKTLHTLTLEP